MCWKSTGEFLSNAKHNFARVPPISMPTYGSTYDIDFDFLIVASVIELFFEKVLF